MTSYKSGSETIAAIRERTDTILLSFSRGKDSIVTWLECRKHFKKIHPVYFYRVPNLEFVEKSLTYYEEFFGCPITRLPHPSTYRQLGNLMFQPPQRCGTIEAAKLPRFTFEQAEDALREDLTLGQEAFSATGVRAADSVRRFMMFRGHTASVNEAKRKFHPIWDWKQDRLIAELEAAGVKLPVDYRVFGRSFDGINGQFLEPMKRYFPRDYERVIEMFPLAELELFRRDMCRM